MNYEKNKWDDYENNYEGITSSFTQFTLELCRDYVLRRGALEIFVSESVRAIFISWFRKSQSHKSHLIAIS